MRHTTDEVRERRFWAKTAAGPDGCIEWTASKLPKGYGVYQKTLAHRWIYARRHEGVTLGRMDFVLHSCDNPSCVNPGHLRLGTPKENTADMYDRGRARPTGPKGPRNPKTKLTAAQVLEYRARHAEGGWTFAGLGREAGVAETTMAAAIKGQHWGHL